MNTYICLHYVYVIIVHDYYRFTGLRVLDQNRLQDYLDEYDKILSTILLLRNCLSMF